MTRGNFLMVGNNVFKNSPEGGGAAADGRSVLMTTERNRLNTAI